MIELFPNKMYNQLLIILNENFYDYFMELIEKVYSLINEIKKTGGI